MNYASKVERYYILYLTIYTISYNLYITCLTLTLAKLIAFADKDATSLSKNKSRITTLPRRQTRHISTVDTVPSSFCDGSEVFISTASMFCLVDWLACAASRNPQSAVHNFLISRFLQTITNRYLCLALFSIVQLLQNY